MCLKRHFQELLQLPAVQVVSGLIVACLLHLYSNAFHANCLQRIAVHHIDLRDSPSQLGFTHIPAGAVIFSKTFGLEVPQWLLREGR